MAGGSTIDNVTPQGKAQGTASEQTELAAQGISLQGKVTPDLDYKPGQDDADTATKARHSTSYSPAPIAWKTVK